MNNIDTIREAIEGLLKAANRNVGGMVPGVIATWCHQALAALSTIDPEAIKQEGDRMAIEIARLIEAHVIDSRSPAADALLDYNGGKFFGPTKAILGTEPARCRGNECESFDCEICDSRTDPAREGS